MARILLGETFFEELAPGSMIEADFERIVVSRGRLIFPQFFVVPFKPSVASDDDIAKPDLALVDQDYRDWWVVEVESIRHPLYTHVLPQVRTLASACYGDAEAMALCNECHELDRARVTEMMKGRQPRVLVLVDAKKAGWPEAMRALDAELIVLQVFRSNRNEHAFRIDGDLPAVKYSVVSDCSFDAYVPRFLLVHSPAMLGIPQGQAIKIKYGEYVTDWKRVDSQDRVWLAPTNQNPLERGQSYQILKNEAGMLEFRSVQERS